ncbi:MAG TPA: hypothetical protein VFZ78_00050 [Flavisolibacter sp.]
MLLTIDDHMTVSDIQDKFSECFPHLRLELYKGQHALKNRNPADGLLRISEISNRHVRGQVDIKSWSKSESVLHELKNRFGLLAAIFRADAGTRLDKHDTFAFTTPTSNIHEKNEGSAESSNDEELRIFL